MISVGIRYLIGTSIFLASSALSSLGVQLQALALKHEREWNELTDDILQDWLDEEQDNNFLPTSPQISALSSRESIHRALQNDSPLTVDTENVSPIQVSLPAGGAIPSSVSSPATLGISIKTLLRILFGKRQHRRISRSDALRLLFFKFQWHIGLALYLVDQAFGSTIALGFIPPIMLAPLGGSGLVFNLFFSSILLGTTITVKDWVGTFLILGGCSIVSIFAATLPDPEYSMKELVQVISRPAFIAYLSTQISLVIGMIVIGHYLGITLGALRLHIQRVVTSSSSQGILSTQSSRLLSGTLPRSSFSAKETLPYLSPVTDSPLASPSSSHRRSLQQLSNIPTSKVDEYNHQHQSHTQMVNSSSNSSVEEFYTPSSETKSLLKKRFSHEEVFDSEQETSSSPTLQSPGQGDLLFCSTSGNRTIPVAPIQTPTRYSSAFSTSSRRIVHQHKMTYLSKLIGMLFSIAGGIMASNTLFLAKSGVNFIVQVLTNTNSQIHEGATAIVLLFILIGTIFTQLYALNQALRYHIPLVVIPIFYTFYSCVSFVSSIMLLDMLLPILPSPPSSPPALGGGIAIFASIFGGLILIISGVWLLGSHHEHHNEHEHPA